MGALMRAIDWSTTPFGPVERWPQSLRTAVSIMLESRFAMVVAWGPEFRFFYNDRYRPILGRRSIRRRSARRAPRSFPRSGRSSARSSSACAAARPSRSTTGCCPLDRNGYLENCWFTLSYSPIRDETGGVGGVLAVVAETTGRVEGRAPAGDAARPGAARGRRDATPEQACANAAAVFEANPIDVPFALIYLLDRDGTTGAPRLPCRHLPADHPASRRDGRSRRGADDAWPLARRRAQRQTAIVLADLPAALRAAARRPVPGADAHRGAAAARRGPGLEHPYGVLVAGVSPRRALDDAYRGFFELAADHIATAIGNAARARGGAAPRRGAGRDRSRQDRVLQQRQPRVPHAADADARPDRGRAGRARTRRCAASDLEMRPPQRAAPAEAGERAARLLAHRGRPRAGVLRADRSRRR